MFLGLVESWLTNEIDSRVRVVASGSECEGWRRKEEGGRDQEPTVHEAVVLYTKGDDGVVLGRLGGLEPWDGAGEMAESRGQGWPSRGVGATGRPSVQDPVFAAFGRQVI